MGKKNNIPKGVRQEFDDVDYWRKIPKNKFVMLDDGSRISEYEWMKKFMHEFYGNNFDRKSPEKNILKTEEQKKEARRNNNNTNRDALLVAKKIGTLTTLFQLERGVESDAEPWEETFKFGTYEDTIKEIILQCCNDLGLTFTTTTARSILKIHFRLHKFIKLIRKDKSNEKDQNGNKD